MLSIMTNISMYFMKKMTEYSLEVFEAIFAFV